MSSTAAGSVTAGRVDPEYENEDEIIGYVEPWIASPGQQVQVKVSSTIKTYSWSLQRIIQGFQHPDGPEVMYEPVLTPLDSVLPGRYKRAACGSYGLIESWKNHRDDVKGIQFSCFVQPWMTEADHEQVIVSTLDVENHSGFAITLNRVGTILAYVGNGRSVQHFCTKIQLRRWKWSELYLSLSEEELIVKVSFRERLAEPAAHPCSYVRELDGHVKLDGTVPLTFAAGFFADAQTLSSQAANIFNGRLDSPHVKVTQDGPRYVTWAHYDFALCMSSDRIMDVSGNSHAGVLVNAPTRAVKGYDWDGSESDWTKASYGYGAIHFHDDDLDDPDWATDFMLQVPKDALSGAYAVVVKGVGRVEVFDHITFFVGPPTTDDNPEAKSKPRVAIVLSTFTYLAYANEHMYDQTRASRMTLAGGVQIRKDGLWRRMARRDDLGCSLYDVHHDGSGCVFSTSKRPILNIRPGYVNWAFHRPREFSADQLMVGLLEKRLGRGGYDVLTDHYVHTSGAAALQKYDVVLTGCHPEYPTLELLQAYSAFARTGGHIMYLGGNGFYWASVLDSSRPHRLEVRKGDQGCRSVELPAGERHHSLNGAQGGLWRSRGRAPQLLFGVGSCACGSGPGVPYRFSDSVLQEKDSSKWGWLLEGLKSESNSSTAEGFLIGTQGFGGGASGDEIDRLDFGLGTPENAVLLATSIGHDDTFGVFNEEMMFPMVDTTGTICPKVRSDMVMYETSGGGSVFSVGSINWYSSLGWDNYENNIAQITWNVLREFIRRGEERVAQSG